MGLQARSQRGLTDERRGEASYCHTHLLNTLDALLSDAKRTVL